MGQGIHITGVHLTLACTEITKVRSYYHCHRGEHRLSPSLCCWINTIGKTEPSQAKLYWAGPFMDTPLLLDPQCENKIEPTQYGLGQPCSVNQAFKSPMYENYGV
jgi:hypothetical protein